MHDSVLSHLRNTLHERLTRHGEHGEHGDVDQARGAGRLFAGDYSASATVGFAMNANQTPIPMSTQPTRLLEPSLRSARIKPIITNITAW